MLAAATPKKSPMLVKEPASRCIHVICLLALLLDGLVEIRNQLENLIIKEDEPRRGESELNNTKFFKIKLVDVTSQLKELLGSDIEFSSQK